MKTKKRDPRSESSIRRALGMRRRDLDSIQYMTTPNWWELQMFSSKGGGLIAIADLRDLYLKREPLKGAMKEIRKVVRRRRS